MTFEEMHSVFDGLGIELGDQHVFDIPVSSSKFAHGFAQTNGVTQAVLNEINGEFTFSATLVANLTKKNVALLRAYGKTGKAPVQFIEVMACEGGCISGPANHEMFDKARQTYNKELQKR
jgi:hypothetical protein